MDNIKEKVEKIISDIGERELEPNDIDMLGKLVDIRNYWSKINTTKYFVMLILLFLEESFFYF